MAAGSKNTPTGDIHVRMYRQGLGDCFLLSFPTDVGGERHLLIDCGVILGTPDAATKMQAVARDIHDRTGGQVHVVAGTHEHWDHLSGFVQAQDVFEQIQIDQVWLSWTEDPSHELARRLRAERRKRIRQLQLTVQKMRAFAVDEGEVNQVSGLLEFFGAPLSAAGRTGTDDALQWLAARTKPRYLRPGQTPITWADVPGVRIFVLGPPEDPVLLRKSDPTKRGKEVYELLQALDADRAFLAAAGHDLDRSAQPTSEDCEIYERSFPFDRRYRIDRKTAQKEAFFRERYGFDSKPPKDTEAHIWRRIESDWLAAAGQLALQLDSDTNNTSLALAIELVPSGDVLLFPADAQVGNWLSWESLEWKLSSSGVRETVTAHDLLRRTVLYKVGHHASHNATLRQKGLELMQSDELVALIPVDEKIAREKKHWNMPFPSLLTRLMEKTRGRVIRADQSVTQLRLRKSPPPGLTKAEWKAFCSRLSADPDDALYIDLQIPLGVR